MVLIKIVDYFEQKCDYIYFNSAVIKYNVFVQNLFFKGTQKGSQKLNYISFNFKMSAFQP